MDPHIKELKTAIEARSKRMLRNACRTLEKLCGEGAVCCCERATPISDARYAVCYFRAVLEGSGGDGYKVCERDTMNWTPGRIEPPDEL